MKRRPISLVAAAVLTAGLLVTLEPAIAPAATAASSCPWVGSSASPAAKASAVLGQMTLDEKLSMTHGSSSAPGYAGSIAAIPRLCIPTLTLNDGGAGVVMGGTTAMPAPIASAATWDTNAQNEYGQVVGSEAKTKGIDVNLGPNVNLVRDPRGGRAFESAGEDPYLAGATATAYVKGVQSQGVMADLKHLVANDVEQNRNNADAVVDERTLNEIYYPAFKQAVQEGDAASIMAATSLLNGVHSNENATLLKDTAKQDWGFDGFVVTDWDGARSTVQAANAQLDLTMPTPGNFGQPLSDAVRKGEVPISVLNDKISRILTEEFQYGLFDNQTGSTSADATSAAHTKTAQDIAAEGTVLMKNNSNLLPLDPTSSQSIVVIGEPAKTAPVTGGGGSSHVPVAASAVSTIADSIAARVGSNGHVEYVGPWNITPFATADAGDSASNMLDGQAGTRWTSGTTQAPGQSLVVDMGAAQTIDQISMDSTTSAGDYAHGYEIYLSTDGTTWGSPVATGTGSTQLITASFATSSARYVKVIQTGTSSSWWSIAEFNVYHSDGSGGQVALSRGGLHVPGTTEKLSTVPTAEFTSVDGKPGLTAEYFNNLDLSGTPALTQIEPNIDDHYTQAPGPGVNAAGFSVRWTGFLTAPVTGTYTFSMANTGGVRMTLGGQSVFNDWAQYGPGTSAIHLVGGQKTPITVENYQPINSATGPVAGTPSSPPTNGSVTLGWQTPDVDAIAAAAAAAKTADVAVVVVNDDEMEDGDRQNLTLPGAQDDLVAAVAAANPKTVVVLNTGAPVLMPWLDSVSSVVESWYGGQANGAALASVLFGDVNPSGKLPQTWPASMSQMPTADATQYPGTVDVSTNTSTLDYSEGLDVGYRWYDAHNVTPLFPFGFGLSYTSFGFSDIAVGSPAADGSRKVTATVTNTGTSTGSEVAQLYLSYPTAAGEPPKTLKGFQRVTLAAGDSTPVTFTLTQSDLQIWDSTAHNWTITPGDYQIHVGDSSRDLPLTAGFTLDATAGNRSAVATAPGGLTPTKGNVVTTTLSTGGTQTLTNVKLGLDVPEGWTATAQTASTFDSAAPADKLTTTWLVTPPSSTLNQIFRVAATATADGGYQTSNGLQVTVGSIVTAKLTSTADMVQSGTPAAANLNLHNGGDADADVTYMLTGATGVTTSPATATVHVPAGGSVDVPFTLTAGSAAASASVDVALQVTIGGVAVPTDGASLTIPILFASLAQAFGNVGVGDHSNPGNANFDGAGFSYSKQGLAAVGVVPGQPIVHGGITYTWPAAADGAPDNVVASGQRIAINQAAKSVSILGAASNGNGTGTGTVVYTDGSSAPFTLALNNWTNSTLIPQDELVATSHEWNPKPGSGYPDALDVSLFSTTITLDPTKTVAYLALPSSSTSDQAGNQLHLFDLQVTPADGQAAASTTTATLSPAAVAVGGATTATVHVTGTGGTPTGTVTISEGTTTLSSKALSNGTANLSIGADLGVGTHVLTVSYPGDGKFKASTTTVTLTVGIAPTVRVVTTPAVPNTTGWYTGPVRLAVVATDPVDPNPMVQAQVDGADWAQISAPLQFTTDGTHTVRVQATNAAGITSAASTWSVKIDQLAPVSNVTFDDVARTLTFTAADGTSGVSRIEYQLPGGGWITTLGSVTVGNAAAVVNYRAIDKAGNIEATHQVSVPKVGVTLLDSSTVASLSKSSVVVGGTVAMTVKVGGSGATPSGTIRVTSGGVQVGQATLTGGRATLTIKGSTFRTGHYTLKVAYSGNAVYAASSDSVALTVTKAVSAIRITLSSARVAYGTTVRATVRVTAAGVTGTGLVTIKDGRTVIGVGRLAAGSVVVKLPTRLSVGTHTLTATYGGDPSVNTSVGTTKLVVVKAASTVKGQVTPTRITTTTKAKIAVTVTTRAPGTTPSGTVTVKVTSGSHAKATTTVHLTRGKATATLPRLAVGTYTVTLAYPGSTVLAPSTSKATVKVVR
ncbi:beta-glucosidase [Nakamurella panacisegetis]|uniref:Beta-glucosidase n=1 Tax=Nakamurella panacisegetis TaxID=1090615 RepID=A0A1H0LSB8_9ACTN|nr:glycoside hydrolase family 3 C-terminal domain-containing protein [Nakamurella panacisegetis]SDO70941.1 beta-glucosidase [Nakamurella panacisegetis]